MIRKTGRRIERVSNLPPAAVVLCLARRVCVGWHNSGDNSTRDGQQGRRREKEQEKKPQEKVMSFPKQRDRESETTMASHIDLGQR